MTHFLLHVRVDIDPVATTHPLRAALYAGDDCVSQTVHHRDMRQVRAYYNGVVAGLTMTGAVRHGETILSLTVSRWPHHAAYFTVPVNLEYRLADGIDPMHDQVV
jgi:hypothetical protein